MLSHPCRAASPSPSPAWKWWRPRCSWTRWSETPRTSRCTATAERSSGAGVRLQERSSTCGCEALKSGNLLLEVNFLLLHELTHPLRLHGFFQQLKTKNTWGKGLQPASCLWGCACRTHKLLFSVVALLWLLQQLLRLVQLSIDQLLLQVFVLHHFVYVLEERAESENPAGEEDVKRKISPPPAACTARTASSASRPAQRSPVGGWRFSCCAAPSEPGCRSESTGSATSPLSVSPPPDGFSVFLPPAERRTFRNRACNDVSHI